VKRKEEQAPPWIIYSYSEDEFKQRLGITDPNHVLTMERNYDKDRTVSIRLTSS
jgi:hypothetical protein